MDPVAGRTVSHYRFEEKLGEGGMGVVYRAVDVKLQRTVALKFLSSAVAGKDELRARFVQEARAASSLDHPNICTIFEIDQVEDGEMFIAMAYYSGQTLDRTLREGPLDPERAVGIALQVARGLAVAHEELIIHRDIKPGNIMITERGTVKILDFGLAKLAGRTELTRPGSSVGTPAYMAPEQIRGEKIDHRVDIWSLGVMLFRMITGKLPFEGDRAESIIHSILNQEPKRVSAVRPGLPEKLDRVIAKALAKSPKARHQKMSELILDLEEVHPGADSAALTVRRPAEKKRSSVAVLPFVNMSADKDQDYFCDGIAEELLIALSGISELHVASRTSAFQFKDTAMDIREIGEKLNVSTVLEGSVRKAGERVRITAQLINIEDGYRLWTGRYEREIEDIFAIQDEIARNIAEALQVTLTGEQEKQKERASTRDVEAYDLYLKGRQFFNQQRRAGYEVARQMFARAIEIDPGYARAHAGIANCSSFLNLYFGHGQVAIDDAERASALALALDPELAEARVAHGLALSLGKRYDEAEAELQKAIELAPDSFDAHYFYARLFQAQGKLADAARMYVRACALAPEVYFTWVLLGGIYTGMGEDTKANESFLQGFAATSAHLKLHPDDTRALTLGAACLLELGEDEKGAEWIERAKAITPDEPVVLYNLACLYLRLGRSSEAIDALESAVEQGYTQKEWIANDPDFVSIRSDPRFQALLDGIV